MNLVGVTLTLSSADLTSMVSLEEGNRIYFGINKGTVTLGLLSSSQATISIAKISN